MTTVFIILASWDNDVPDFNIEGVYAPLADARAVLKELIENEYAKGMLKDYDPDDEDEDWEFTQDEDIFIAESDYRTHWLRIEIIGKTVVQDSSPLSMFMRIQRAILSALSILFSRERTLFQIRENGKGE